MKVLRAFLVMYIALFTTEVIMNVSASMEAPRNPAKINKIIKTCYTKGAVWKLLFFFRLKEQ